MGMKRSTTPSGATPPPVGEVRVEIEAAADGSLAVWPETVSADPGTRIVWTMRPGDAGGFYLVFDRPLHADRGAVPETVSGPKGSGPFPVYRPDRDGACEVVLGSGLDDGHYHYQVQWQGDAVGSASGGIGIVAVGRGVMMPLVDQGGDVVN
ncbi:hypothetical protein LDO26_07820 [Luteimonas sp. BDR2-5]|uniref:hypothetical protein n=1 Tax=Proluteimonas luteida TaxID=2878685 RepID=UPI001E3FEA50|nr:hypothetical protein [Luteimonas sp. BDR2-5]MCD9028115.1 hypothetical protein [Luteimonas sp. BDR2-5]